MLFSTFMVPPSTIINIIIIFKYKQNIHSAFMPTSPPLPVIPPVLQGLNATIKFLFSKKHSIRTG